jgi:hypothetical protein
LDFEQGKSHKRELKWFYNMILFNAFKERTVLVERNTLGVWYF